MKQIIADIKSRLAEKVAGLRYIDEDWGQLDYYNPNQPVKWPCAIIDIDQVNWGNQGSLVQIGLASISVRVADMKISNTNQKAPLGQKQKAAEIFDLITAVHQALHGWTADSMNGPLTRLLTRKVNRDDGIREFEITYSVQVVDDTAKPVPDLVEVKREKINIMLQLQKP